MDIITWIKSLNTELNEKSLVKQQYMLRLYESNPIFLLNYSKTLFIMEGERIEILKLAKKSLSCIAIETALASSYHTVGNLEDAERFYINACNMVPNRFTPKYEAFIFYFKTDQTKKQ